MSVRWQQVWILDVSITGDNFTTCKQVLHLVVSLSLFLSRSVLGGSNHWLALSVRAVVLCTVVIDSSCDHYSNIHTNLLLCLV